MDANLLNAFADALETASKLARSLAAENDANALADRVEERINRREEARRAAENMEQLEKRDGLDVKQECAAEIEHALGIVSRQLGAAALIVDANARLECIRGYTDILARLAEALERVTL